MKITKMKFRYLIPLGLTIILLAVSVTWALAQVIADGGVIYACVLKDGTLRIVSDANQCRKGEALLTWNIMGPAGPKGDTGATGPQGPKGDTGPQGVPGSASLSALQGTTCTVGGVASTLQITTDPGTGLVSLVCSPRFSITNLKSMGYKLAYSSIAIGKDKLPVISYIDINNNAMEVAHCNDAACRSATLTKLDDLGEEISIGLYTSITIGVDGLPIISYYDYKQTLKVAHCINAACTYATISTPDSDALVGSNSPITIGEDGLPVICYRNSLTGHLRVAHCNDKACKSAIFNGPESTDDAYTRSITIGVDGLPVISYEEMQSGALKVAHCNDPACKSATLNTVDSGGYLGQDSSIVIGADGLPVISYWDATNSDLKVAHCNDPACKSASLNLLDSEGNVGAFNSITIGSDWLPVISYLDNTKGKLKIAHCNDFACNIATLVDIPDSTGGGGLYTSITTGMDGWPIISNFGYNGNGFDLKVAHCVDAICTP